MHYVLSDIHGCCKAFEAILSMIRLQRDDHLYILGDVIDRGSDGIALLQRIRKMENCVLLLGDHEHMMINALRNRNDDCVLHAWRENGGEPTYAAFCALDAGAQEDLLRHLEGLPLQTSVTIQSDAGEKEYILVHAAPKELFKTEGGGYKDEREFIVQHKMALQLPPELAGKTYVIGHTPTICYDEREKEEGLRMRIAYGKGVIDIDCGCSYPQYGGRLGCLRLEDLNEYYWGKPWWCYKAKAGPLNMLRGDLR